MKNLLALAVVAAAVSFAGADVARADHCSVSPYGGSFGGFGGYSTQFYPSQSYYSRSNYYPSQGYRNSYIPSYGQSYGNRFVPRRNTHNHGRNQRYYRQGFSSPRRSGGIHIRSGNFSFGLHR